MKEVYKDLKSKRNGEATDVGLGFAEKWLPEKHERQTVELNLPKVDSESNDRFKGDIASDRSGSGSSSDRQIDGLILRRDSINS
jgi:hypothetical protein